MEQSVRNGGVMAGVVVHGDGLVLRPWTVEDADEVHRLVADPEIPRYMGIPADAPVEARRAWLAGRDEAWESGLEATWAITDESGELLGSVGVNLSGDDPAVAEIGYWIGAHARRQGVATRAVRLAAAWTFEHWAVARLEITTHTDNEASMGVARAAGFRREGVLRAYREHNGARVDLVMFSRLAGEPDR